MDQEEWEKDIRGPLEYGLAIRSVALMLQSSYSWAEKFRKKISNHTTAQYGRYEYAGTLSGR